MNTEQIAKVASIVAEHLKTVDNDYFMMVLGPVICTCIDELIEEGKLELC